MSKALQRATKVEVKRLLESTQHALTVDDVDEIVRIDGIIADAVHPTDGAARDLLNTPERVGRVLLRRPCTAKIAWYNSRALVWFADDPALPTIALAYCCAVANAPEALDKLDTAKAARRTLYRWARRNLGDVTPADLNRAIERVAPSANEATAEQDKDEEAQTDYGPVMGALAREYGGTPSSWFWREDWAFVDAMLDDYVRRVNAEIEAHNRASKGKGPKIAKAVTPKLRAEIAWKEALKKLGETWAQN